MTEILQQPFWTFLHKVAFLELNDHGQQQTAAILSFIDTSNTKLQELLGKHQHLPRKNQPKSDVPALANKNPKKMDQIVERGASPHKHHLL